MKNMLKKFAFIVSARRFVSYYLSFAKNILFVRSVQLEEKIVVRHRNGSLMTLPYRSIWNAEARQLSILSNNYLDHIVAKYTTEGFAIERDEVVVDCGSFVGGFALAAAKKFGANNVIAIEPTPLSRECLKINRSIYDLENEIMIVPAGLGASCGQFDLNLSKSGCDNSFLTPDAGFTGRSVSVDVLTFDELAKRCGIGPDAKIFFKVEAEGFEPEVIAGITHIKPVKIVIDVTPERNGNSPVSDILPLLEERGYHVFKQTKRCLFAILIA